MYFLRQGRIIRNLLVMGYMWGCTSFCQYLIMIYVKYLPGNIYTNSITSNISQNIAALLAGAVYSRVGIRISFSVLYTISALGGLLILFIGYHDDTWMPLFVGIAMFGCSGAFTLVYVST
jgi:hypothetical protein